MSELDKTLHRCDIAARAAGCKKTIDALVKFSGRDSTMVEAVGLASELDTKLEELTHQVRSLDLNIREELERESLAEKAEREKAKAEEEEAYRKANGGNIFNAPVHADVVGKEAPAPSGEGDDIPFGSDEDDEGEERRIVAAVAERLRDFKDTDKPGFTTAEAITVATGMGATECNIPNPEATATAAIRLLKEQGEVKFSRANKVWEWQ